MAPERPYGPWIRKTVALGLVGAAVAIFGGWRIKMALYGDHYAIIPGATFQDQIRFGPNNTDAVK